MTKKIVQTKKEVKSIKSVKTTKKPLTQIEKLSNYLTKHGKITRTEAVSMGITSVSSAVNKLRNRGMKIESTTKSVKGKTFVTYSIQVSSCCILLRGQELTCPFFT